MINEHFGSNMAYYGELFVNLDITLFVYLDNYLAGSGWMRKGEDRVLWLWRSVKVFFSVKNPVKRGVAQENWNIVTSIRPCVAYIRVAMATAAILRRHGNAHASCKRHIDKITQTAT